MAEEPWYLRNVMVSLALLLVLQGKPRLAPKMIGLWRGEESQSFYHFESGSVVHYFADGMHGEAKIEKSAPDGADLGAWAQSAQLPFSAGHYLTRSPPRWDVRQGWEFGQVDGSPLRDVSQDSGGDPGYHGWFQIIEGPRSGSGGIAYYTVNRLDPRGFSFKSEKIFYVGNLDKVVYGRSYGDDHGGLSWTWPANAKDHIVGDFNYLGVRAKLEGFARGTRGVFRLFDLHSGDFVGYGAFEWRPDPKQLAELDTTDSISKQITVEFHLAGATNANGLQCAFKLKGPA